ncbi:MAG: translation initiation factor IF-2 subunit alpha [Fervidicoccaceae archaeon]
MVKSRRKLPEIGELVVATVKEIFDFGAYVELDEYEGTRAYLPWSEVASKWVRDVRELLRENQKIVVKVIRVDRSRGHIDVSLKRVYDSERKRKMMEFKRKQKAEKILEEVARSLGKTLDQAYEEAGWKLEDYYGEIWAALERASLEGEEVFLAAGVPREWARALLEEARKHVEVKKVTVEGILRAWTLRPDGVEALKRVFEAALGADGAANVKITITALGAPRYKIEVEAEDYKTAEEVLAEAVRRAEEAAKREKVELHFQRVKK